MLLKPLQLIFEFIFAAAYRLLDNPGASIIVLSLAINLLVLPLYMRADALQEEERQMEKKLRRGVAHIKKTFHGDEQMMMLSTYYRQNNYKPAYVLRSAVSLFLQIPFFIAAYRFLSGLELLNGVSFGPIADLGNPDGMLRLGGMSVNVLPFAMTGINLCSCVIFTKGSPLKEKLQLYGMALFFLVFLYDSPSGLVFYWMLNNLFSLVKTVLYKLKNPKKVICVSASAAGIAIWIYGFFIYAAPTSRRILFYAFLGLLFQMPLLLHFLNGRGFIRNGKADRLANSKNFLSGCLFLSALTGILIPSAVISSSPQEFVNTSLFYHPIWFIVSSFCMACGIFLIWMGVFYQLAGSSMKPLFDRGVWVLSGTMLIDYMFFNRNFGNLSASLQYENELQYTLIEQMLNIIILFVAALALLVVYRNFEKKISGILLVGILAVAVMSVANISDTVSSVKLVKEQMKTEFGIPEFTLSRNGKNVIVLMLDRALGEQVPFIFDEKPELKEQFDGFTHYSNTISFGTNTNYASPALLGGYEYTPAEMNKRDQEPLVEKHNEALKVMPVLFSQNGYDVTVVNPPYANYQYVPDLTIYDEYPDIARYNIGEQLMDRRSTRLWIETNKRNFFCYSIMKSIPLFTQKTVYNNGRYNQADSADETVYSLQTPIDSVIAEGIDVRFMKQYAVLENLSDIGSITDDDTGTFLFMVNDITHYPMLLQEPDYVPMPYVDNTEYEDTVPSRTLDGRTLKLENRDQLCHYHVNMAAMIQLGKWFDYLREKDVYNNTRIILVSDHGWATGSLDELILDDGTLASALHPLLMVKDFDADGFTASDAFMTNADVPSIATNGIIDYPVNLFTGKTINSDEKTAHDQYISWSLEGGLWDTNKNNGNTFLPVKWYSVHDNIWERDNWKLIAEDAVLTTDDY